MSDKIFRGWNIDIGHFIQFQKPHTGLSVLIKTRVSRVCSKSETRIEAIIVDEYLLSLKIEEDNN